MNSFEPKQFGKYYLIEKIAVGGMAEIYKAKTFGVDGFEKLLAIKRILPHCAADKDFITMLIDEAKLTVSLSHANIVQVYDLGKIGDDYFISMEYIHGINLRDIMYRCRETQRPIPPEISVYIIAEVCKGLDYAHRKSDAQGQPLNIIHRDISPQNILLSYEGEVKIVDFGIAKAAMNISHTMAGILKGKIAYMSPEQALGKAIDNRTDIFSAGILLYEMLSNSKLYTGESQFEVLKKIRTTKIEEEKLPGTIPQPLKWVVAKALAYKSDDRFQNAGDLQIELTKFLYSTYLDFSPRKLAAFIKELFSSELKEEQMRRARETALESQTASLSVAEGAKQMEIVHRETSVTPIEPRPPETAIETMLTPAAAVEEKEATTERKRMAKKKPARWPKLALSLAILAAVVYGTTHFIPSARFWERKPVPEAAEAIGTIDVTSNPDGAKVLLNGEDTGLTTPATIKSLMLNTPYVVRLEKDEFKPVERRLKLSSAQPVPIELELQKMAGVMDISSEPTGANISIDGKATGKTTPATIEDIPLLTDHRIKLTKQDFEDFEQVVNLTGSKPQKIAAILKVAQKPSIPPPATPPVTPPVAPPATPPVTTPPTAAIPALAPAQPAPPPAEAAKATVKPAEKPAKATKPPPSAPAEKPVETTPPPAGVSGGTPAQIKIASNPSGAEVFINAEYKGKTPLTASVQPGSVSIIVNKEGLARYSRKITVRPGEKVNLTDINLSDLYGEVSLSSVPPRANVVFDGQAIPAKTPVTIRKVRRDQQHSVSISLPGYRTWSTSFSMDGGDKSFNAILEQ